MQKNLLYLQGFFLTLKNMALEKCIIPKWLVLYFYCISKWLVFCFYTALNGPEEGWSWKKNQS